MAVRAYHCACLLYTSPQVAYKETFTKAVDVDSKYAKQSGGRGQYGHCKVKFEPMDANGEEPVSYTHLDVYKRQLLFGLMVVTIGVVLNLVKNYFNKKRNV